MLIFAAAVLAIATALPTVSSGEEAVSAAAPTRAASSDAAPLEAPLASSAAPPAAPSREPASPEADPHQLFTEANRLFKGARSEEDLRAAAERYRSLLRRGIPSGPLHYNLGSAHLRLKEWGPAILHLRRALLYRPEDEVARATLEYARKHVPGGFAGPAQPSAMETLLFWHHRTPFHVRLWTALLANALFWTLLCLGTAARIPFRRTALAGLALVAAAAGGSAAAEGLLRRGEEAVLVLPHVEARSGDGTGYAAVFSEPVPGGVEVRVLEARGSWRLLEFPGGARGWVPESAVEEVAPGREA